MGPGLCFCADDCATVRSLEVAPPQLDSGDPGRAGRHRAWPRTWNPAGSPARHVIESLVCSAQPRPSVRGARVLRGPAPGAGPELLVHGVGISSLSSSHLRLRCDPV